jgi:hypothetical protein
MGAFGSERLDADCLLHGFLVARGPLFAACHPSLFGDAKMTFSLIILLWTCGAVAHMAVFAKLFNRITLWDALLISFTSWAGVLVGGMVLVGRAAENSNLVIWERK